MLFIFQLVPIDFQLLLFRYIFFFDKILTS